MNKKQPDMKAFLEQQKTNLRKAILDSDSEAETEILSAVSKIYGNDYARQWRNIVAEELGLQRIQQTTKNALKGFED